MRKSCLVVILSVLALVSPPAEAGFLDGCQRLASHLFGAKSSLKMDDFAWGDQPRPPEALWNQFVKFSGGRLNGSKGELLMYIDEAFKLAALLGMQQHQVLGRFYNLPNGQRLGPATPWNLRILDLSDLETSPHEVGNFSFRMSRGNIVRDPMILNGFEKHIDIEDVMALFQSAVSRLSESGDKFADIKEVIFTHSHPIPTILDTKTWVTYYFPLSQGDLHISRLFSSALHQIDPQMRFTIEAVCPPGFTFAQTFP